MFKFSLVREAMRLLGLVLVCGFIIPGCQKVDEPTTNIPQNFPVKKWQARQDGAPPGPLPTEFETVSPKQESLSRYGNPSTYHVKGKTYDVLTSAKGYRERGIASWYGTKFHEHRTSSGEEYDMYALTAAHKTLPLPSYVQVKNLKNGRKIIVKVNDRGPFHEGRIIDLSYGAAVKLGLFPKGTAPVEVKVVSARKGQKKVARAQYYLQAGAFSTKNAARAYRDKLLKITPSSNITIEEYQTNQIVKLGPITNKKQAEQLSLLLKENGVEGVFSFLE